MPFDGYGFQGFAVTCLIAEQAVEAAAMRERTGCNHRIAEHERIRAHRVGIIAVLAHYVIARGGGQIGRKMPACGESDHRDSAGVAMPFVGMGTDTAHRFGGLQQCDGETGRRDGIPQYERVVPGRKETHGNRLGFTVRSHGVPATGNHQHARAAAFGVDFLTVVMDVADECGFTAVDTGDHVFEISHESTLPIIRA